MVDIPALAAEADAVVKQIEKFEPTVATVSGMFIPGAGPFINLTQPMIALGLEYLDRALGDVASGNGSDLGGAFIDLLNHITKGKPNAPSLAPAS